MELGKLYLVNLKESNLVYLIQYTEVFEIPIAEILARNFKADMKAKCMIPIDIPAYEVLKEVQVIDLPLYIDWFLTPKFEEALNGHGVLLP